jgi:hypothetical protein
MVQPRVKKGKSSYFQGPEVKLERKKGKEVPNSMP